MSDRSQEMKTYTKATVKAAPEGYYWFKRQEAGWQIVSVDQDEYTSIFISDIDSIYFFDDDDIDREREFTLVGPLVPPNEFNEKQDTSTKESP